MTAVQQTYVELQVKVESLVGRPLVETLNVVHAYHPEIFLIRTILLVKAPSLIHHLPDVVEPFLDQGLLLVRHVLRIDATVVSSEILKRHAAYVLPHLDGTAVVSGSVAVPVLAGSAIRHLDARTPPAWRPSDWVFKRGKRTEAQPVDGCVHFSLQLLLPALSYFWIAARFVESVAPLFELRHDEGIFPMPVRQQLVFGVGLIQQVVARGVWVEHGAVYTRNVVLVRKSLESVYAGNGFVVLRIPAYPSGTVTLPRVIYIMLVVLAL